MILVVIRRLMFITSWVAFGASAAATTSTAATYSGNSPKPPMLLRRRESWLLDKATTTQAMTTTTPTTPTTERDVHRALTEGVAFGSGLADWKNWPSSSQPNIGSFSFSYPRASFSYPMASDFSYPPPGGVFSFSYPPFSSGEWLSVSFPDCVPSVVSSLSFPLHDEVTLLSFSFPPRGEGSFSVPPVRQGLFSFSFPAVMEHFMSYPTFDSKLSFSSRYLDPADENGLAHGSKESSNIGGETFGTNHDHKDESKSIKAGQTLLLLVLEEVKQNRAGTT